MTRKRIHVILLSERGAMASVAKRLGVTPVTVHNYLRGRLESARVGLAVEAAATRILERKGKDDAAA